VTFGPQDDPITQEAVLQQAHETASAGQCLDPDVMRVDPPAPPAGSIVADPVRESWDAFERRAARHYREWQAWHRRRQG
jgi:hypothetical protein